MKFLSRVKPMFWLLLFPGLVGAADSPKIVINEIAWMGTKNSSNDEWIELYNNSENSINLSGWTIKSADEIPEVKLAGAIAAKSFYLLERTDDNTVPEITADQIYTGALGNNGENLELYDNSGNLIDFVNCNSAWFQGDNESKKTMEKISPLADGNNKENWQTSQNSGGTPKTQNSTILLTETPKSAIDTQEKLTGAAGTGEGQSGDSPQFYPFGIIFSEILPSAQGPDETEEFIEIFNSNNFGVDLSGWKIKDSKGKTVVFEIPKETKISGQGFLVFYRPATKITLNNSQDQIILLFPNGEIADSVEYKTAPWGKSYNKINSDWEWSENLTPGEKNIISEERQKQEAAKEASEEIIPEKSLASVAKPFFLNSKNFFLTLFIALTLAIFSAIIILLLKRKIKTANP